MQLFLHCVRVCVCANSANAKYCSTVGVHGNVLESVPWLAGIHMRVKMHVSTVRCILMRLTSLCNGGVFPLLMLHLKVLKVMKRDMPAQVKQFMPDTDIH